MANADGRLFNVDRWVIYTMQRKPNADGRMLPLTPAQRRRCKKKMYKNKDYSIGMSVSRYYDNR